MIRSTGSAANAQRQAASTASGATPLPRAAGAVQ